MATVNVMCNEIIETVNNSGLDYSINLTPYSIHLSIRKKFSKLSSSTSRRMSSASSSIGNLCQNNDSLRQELLNTRNEYQKLFNFYQSETELTAKLKAELAKEADLKHEIETKLANALEKTNLKDNRETHAKKLKAENQNLQERCENKSLEIKHLKTEIENLKKDKNILSVALKGSKQENKELGKVFDKERSLLESKIVDLSAFKTKKLNEEKEEKSKKRKEIKKARQKMKSDMPEISLNQTLENNNVEKKDAIKHITDEKLAVVKEDKSTTEPNEPLTTDEEPKKQIATGECLKKVEGPEIVEDSAETNLGTDDDCFDENAEGFIGPKLPPRMTKEEIDVFYKEMMAKFKLDDLLKN